MAFTKNKGDKTTTDGAKAGGAPTKNNWVGEALNGTYKFDTGGTDKKGKKPGFSKKGSVGAKHDKKMKGMAPTHGSDGGC